ncbi:MAG: TetR/AcrR family transcriptional regulator [Vicinamibacterales bacterium]
MKTSSRRRRYTSRVRSQSAHETRRRILGAAAFLFTRKGIDRVTIDEIGKRAKVAASTVYANYRSKDGILRGLMEQSLFGPQFQDTQKLLTDVTDPVALIELTSHVSRAIYESESSDLGLLRRASGFSPALRKLEEEFERLRYEKQAARLELLFASGKARPGLSLEEARRILWMYTSRDVYRMLVNDGGWTAARYQQWLSRTLVEALIASPGPQGK